MPEFGLLVHRPPKGPVNIGDYVQGIAVQQALGSRDVVLLEREDLASYRGDPLKVVGQGWYSHTDGAWPPSPAIDYLPFGIHVTPPSYERFTREASLAALRRLSPIGCRDHVTRKFLVSHGIDAYFSSCLTVTIQPSAVVRKPEAIYLIDASPSALGLLPASLASLPVRRLSHLIEQPANRVLSHEEWFAVAQSRLDEYYAKAAVVVTSRLHALLPSLAMGIPCLWVERRLLDRRLDLARIYARPQIFPKPDRVGQGVGSMLEQLIHPALAQVARVVGSPAEARLSPKMDMKAERLRILAALREAQQKQGWTAATTP
jgi:hypothetical protein